MINTVGNQYPWLRCLGGEESPPPEGTSGVPGNGISIEDVSPVPGEDEDLGYLDGSFDRPPVPKSTSQEDLLKRIEALPLQEALSLLGMNLPKCLAKKPSQKNSFSVQHVNPKRISDVAPPKKEEDPFAVELRGALKYVERLLAFPVNDEAGVEWFARLKQPMRKELLSSSRLLERYAVDFTKHLLKERSIYEKLEKDVSLRPPFCNEVAIAIRRVIQWDYAGGLSEVFTQSRVSQEVHEKLEERFNTPLNLSEIVVFSFKEVEEKEGVGVFFRKEGRSHVIDAVTKIVQEKKLTPLQQKQADALIEQEMQNASALAEGELYNSFRRRWIYEFLDAFPIEFRSQLTSQNLLKKLLGNAIEILTSEKNQLCFFSAQKEYLKRREICLAFSEAVGIWSCNYQLQIDDRESFQSEAFENLAQFFVKTCTNKGLQLVDRWFANEIVDALARKKDPKWCPHEIMGKDFRSWVDSEINQYIYKLEGLFPDFLLVNKESIEPSEKACDVQVDFQNKVISQVRKGTLAFRKQQNLSV